MTTIPEPPALKLKAPRLFEVRLPAGDVGSINVGWFSNGAKINLSVPSGYDGLRILGEGADRTVIRCDSWDGNTIAVGKQPTTVRIEEATVYPGISKAIHFGTPGGPIVPQFALELHNCKFASLPATAAGRTKWQVFGYQAGLKVTHCEFDGLHLSEHDIYWHHTTHLGIVIEDCVFQASGAQQIKLRSDASEGVWAGKNVWMQLRRNTHKNCHQVWTDRGGGFVVVEGGGINILAERNAFFGGPDLPGIPAHLRARAFSISSEGNSYDCDTGRLGVGSGNGWIVLRENAMRGLGEAPPWHNDLIYIGRNGGTQNAAKAVWVDSCGAWGRGYEVQISQVPKDKTIIRKCNTPWLRAYCGRIGMDTTHEAVVSLSDRQAPLSEGLVR